MKKRQRNRKFGFYKYICPGRDPAESNLINKENVMRRHQKLKISLGPLQGEATGALAVVCLVVIAILIIL